MLYEVITSIFIKRKQVFLLLALQIWVITGVLCNLAFFSHVMPIQNFIEMILIKYVITSYSIHYTKLYEKSDLNSKYVSYTGLQLNSQLQNITTMISHTHGSDVYRLIAESNSLSKEVNVRNSLGYTVDLSGNINGKLKTMQGQTSYFYNQRDSAWKFSNGGQIACAATACATMMSLNGVTTKPNQISTDSYNFV